MMKKNTYVKRSCLTGEIVWVCRSTSRSAAYCAYWRTCKHEVTRIRHWMQRMEKRKRRLLGIIIHDDSSSASSAALREMTPAQRRAVNEVKRIIERQPSKHSDYYDHIIEEARRRNLQSERWKENREKMIRYGQTYTASEYKPNGKSHGGDRKSEKYRRSKPEQRTSSNA